MNRSGRTHLISLSLFSSSMALNLFFVLLVFSTSLSVAAETLFTVALNKDRLTVNASNAPLRAVIEDIARQTGIELQGVEALQGETSLGFEGLPLREGLQRLLRNSSYAIVELDSPEQGKPVMMLVFGRQPNSSTGKKGGTTKLRHAEANIGQTPASTSVSGGKRRDDERPTRGAVTPTKYNVHLRNDRTDPEYANQPGNEVMLEDWVSPSRR